MIKSLLKLLIITMLGSMGTEAIAACLQTPIPGTIITSNFGLRFHPVYRTWKPHRGTDMRAAMYTPVNAANTGTVIFSGYQGGGGNVIKIQGSDGVMTDYLHLSKAGVAVGQTVNAGQRIALSGNTGHASAAPHLHFQVKVNGGSTLVDPKSMLCESLPEKPGSGPDRTSPDGYPAPNVTSGGEWVSTPAGGGTGISASITPFQSYEGMSEAQIMQTESERRFLNNDWHLRMANCDTDFLQSVIDLITPTQGNCENAYYREAASISLLSNWIRGQKMETVERIESLLAVKHAITARNVSQEKLNQIRARVR